MNFCKNNREIIKEYINEYNSFDLLSKISALNLVFKNQDKTILLQTCVKEIITNLNNKKNIIDIKKFRMLLSELKNLEEKQLIDPPFSPFCQKIYYDKEYYVFNGINVNAAYSLNRLCDVVIRHNKFLLNQEFVKKLDNAILLGLTISDYIYNSTKSNFKDITKHDRIKEEISCPKNIASLVGSLIFDENFIYGLIDQKIFDEEFLLNGKKNEDFSQDGEGNFPNYFTSPFYKYNGKILLIDPSAITVMILTYAKKLALQYNCLDSLANLYIELCWTRIIKDLGEYLNDFSLNDCFKTLGFKGKLPNGVKDRLIKINNNKFIRLIVFFDDLTDENNVIKHFDKQTTSKVFKIRAKEYKKRKISKGNILNLVITNNYLRFIQLDIRDKYDFLMFSSDFLEDITINEINNNNFFFGLYKTKEFYKTKDIIEDFRLVSIIDNYPGKGFYYNDECCLYEDIHNIYIDYSCVYNYTTKAINNLKDYSVLLNGSPMKFSKIKRNYYVQDKTYGNNGDLIFCSQNGTFNIWFYCTKYDDPSLFVTFCLLYWLSEYREIIKNRLSYDVYIKVVTTDEKGVSFVMQGDFSIRYYVQKDLLKNGSDGENGREKYVFIRLIRKIDEQFKTRLEPCIARTLNDKKQKFQYTINLYGFNQILSAEFKDVTLFDEMIFNIIQDKVGIYCINELKIMPGPINDVEPLCIKLVDYLFKKFEEYASVFDYEKSMKYIYKSIFILYNLSASEQIIGDNKILMFPEDEERIFHEYYEENNTLSCLRFIAEYFGTIQPQGKYELDNIDVQYLLSLVETINIYGNFCDAVHYKAIENSLVMTKSKRIAYPDDKLRQINQLMNKCILNDIKKHNKYQNISLDNELQIKINEAYLDEFGVSLLDINSTISILSSFGIGLGPNDLKHGEIYEIYNAEYLLDKKGIDYDTFVKCVDILSLNYRDKYFDGRYLPRDLEPWKNHRAYSLNRKPIFKVGKEIYWNDMFLFISYSSLMNDFVNGNVIHTENKKIREVVSKLGDSKGEQYNKFVYNTLKTKFPEFDFYYQVKTVNNHRIKSKNKMDLGDIDVLCIDKSSCSIILIEVKDYALSTDIKSLMDEKNSMFVGTEHKLSFLAKELRRFEWAKKHIDDFKSEYNLSDDRWKVKYTFITSHELVSKELVDLKINHITLKNIDNNYFKKLK